MAPGAGDAGSGGGKAGKIGIAVAAVVLLMGGVAFAVTNLGGSSGPSSPSDAVELLLDSVANEDVLGVLEAIDPGERDAVLEDTEAVFGELQRLDVVSGSAELSGIDGVDISFDDMQLETEEIRPGLERVYLAGGTVTVQFEPGDLPAGDLVHDMLDRFGVEPLHDLPGGEESFEITSTGNPEDLFLVARDTGSDGWRVSLGYTMAEWERITLGEPPLGGGITPIGEDSPEAAVAGFIGLVESLDPTEAIARLSPSEFRALHEYADILLGPLPPPPDFGPVSVTIDDLDLTARTSGNRADVTIEGFAITVASEEGIDGISGAATMRWDGDELSVTLEWDDIGPEVPSGSAVLTLADDCVLVDSDAIIVDFILDELGAPDGEICSHDITDLFGAIDGEFTVDGMPVDDLDGFPDFGDLDWLADMEIPDLSIRTVRVDGEWYVAPIGTFGGLVANTLAVIERDHVEMGIDLIVEMAESFDSMFEDPFDTSTGPPSPGSGDPDPNPPDESTNPFEDWDLVPEGLLDEIEPHSSLDLDEEDMRTLWIVTLFFFEEDGDVDVACAYEAILSGEVDTDEILRSFHGDEEPSTEVNAIMDDVADAC